MPPNPLFAPCSAPATVSLTGPADSATADAPLKAAASCPYLTVGIGIPFLRRCAENTYFIQWKNAGTAPATAAELMLTMDSLFEFVGLNVPNFTQNGQVLTVPLGDVAAGAAGLVKLTVKVSCAAALGQEHCLVAHLSPDALCIAGLAPDFEKTDCRVNRGAWDPNEKEASVGGVAGKETALAGQPIDYTIHFQNPGTDTAFRVVVEDRLPASLDAATIAPTVWSHPFSMELIGDDRLRFIFEKIMLPDSGIDQAGSQGFVRFSVGQKPGLPVGTEIRNYANIFFDANDPVRTNTSVVTVDKGSAVPPVCGSVQGVFAAPNPFAAVVAFELVGHEAGEKTLVLTDMLGRVSRVERFTGDRFSMRRDGLATGVYFFKVSDSTGLIGSGKLIAQ